MTRDEAKRIIDAIVIMREASSDATASITPDIFPKLKYDNSLIKAGTRINWNGIIKRAAIDLWDTEYNNPDNAPTLWEDLEYKDGYRIIPEIITVGTAFALGQRGWWNDKLYESKLASNVYNPDQYPDGWLLVE